MGTNNSTEFEDEMWGSLFGAEDGDEADREEPDEGEEEED